jgi:hypothetical protein
MYGQVYDSRTRSPVRYLACVLREDKTARFGKSPHKTARERKAADKESTFYGLLRPGSYVEDDRPKGFIFMAGRGRKHSTYTYFAQLAGPKQGEKLLKESHRHPVQIPAVHHHDDLTGEPDVAYWLYRGKFYVTEELELDDRDVLALLTEVENKKRLKLEKAHALMAMREQLDKPAKRQAIPQEVKVAVWQRDKGRCV